MRNIIVVLVVVLLVAGGVQGANFVLNGNFENPAPFSNWFKAGDSVVGGYTNTCRIVADNGESDFGSQCAELYSPTATKDIRSWATPVNPGTILTVSFDYKMSPVSGITTDGMKFREMVRFFASEDASHNTVGQVGSSIKYFFTYNSSIADVWLTNTVTLSVPVPAGAYFIDMNFATRPSDGTFYGQLRIDNVVVTPEPATIAMLGLGLAMLTRRGRKVSA